MKRNSLIVGAAFAWAFLASIAIWGCAKKTPEMEKVKLTSPEVLEEQCRDYVGKPRVEKITDRVWVAIGYDLANVVLIHTDDGNVIVDTAMSPARAKEIQKAFAEEAPQGPVNTIIYTHSHIDHIGGASAFVEEGTEIWANEAFVDHFLKQYGMFMDTEKRRAFRQFGKDVPIDLLPCSALGRRMDFEAALKNGVRMPTHTFSESKKLDIGGVKIELIEAYGETHDEIVVWLPEEDTLIAADDFYWTFPNLYTIRGTSPRPVDKWIESLDKMRRLQPERLVPTHTIPIRGKDEIQQALTDYRDAIQWVRDEVVRAANAGKDIETISETVELPPHLAEKRYLRQMYGQVDWSAKAIYSNALGWFDGSPEKLYPMDHNEIALREVTLLGGPEKVMQMAEDALASDDPKWAVHLLTKLDKSGLDSDKMQGKLDRKLAEGYQQIAEGVYNTNGRGYLLQSAIELVNPPEKMPEPQMTEEVATAVPLEKIFSIMATRLDVEKARDMHRSVQFVFPDEDKRFVVTVRKGVAEVVEGEPLPGTPEPVAVFTSDADTYRKLALGLLSPAKAFGTGKIKIKGSKLKFVSFLNLFETGV